MDSFRTHLDAYLTLFTKLPQLRFYYIATRDTNFERAKRVFRETFQTALEPGFSVWSTPIFPHAAALG